MNKLYPPGKVSKQDFLAWRGGMWNFMGKNFKK
jgi:hypothetical protein